MNFFSIIMISVGLAMDAFAVAVSNSMCYKNMNRKWAFINVALFGIAQAMMPMIGWGLGKAFQVYIEKIDHYVALILLSYIGIKMIVEGIQKLRNPEIMEFDKKITWNILLIQAIATSIDALAVGISLAALPEKISITTIILIIGMITFALVGFGLLMGKKIGNMIGEKAEIFGGIILCFIGLKIFIEHVFF